MLLIPGKKATICPTITKTTVWCTLAPTTMKPPGAVALEYMGLEDDTDGTWSFIRLAQSSVADLAIVPMQDYLDLGSFARMNTPSTVNSENWSWRMEKGAASKELAKKIARMTDLCGRARFLPPPEEKPKKAQKKAKKAKEGKDDDVK